MMWKMLCLIAAVLAGAAAAQEIMNGGFEQLEPDGRPVAWDMADGGFKAGAVTTEQPRSGVRAGRIVGDGEQRAWRQHVEAPPTRLYRVSGWFRARDLKLAPEDKEQFARFYIHLLYRDRPYAEASHIYADIPAGTYDWRRFSLRLVPRVEWPLERIRVTVAVRATGGTLDFDDLELAPASGVTGGASVLESANGAAPVTLTDLSQCQPAAAMAETTARGKWRLIPYEAGGRTGKMVWSASDQRAPELRLPLGVSGWHAVYVGVADPAYLGSQALLRLTKDPAPVPRARGAGALEETFKVADLTGQDLHIGQQQGGDGIGCGVAYVKLVPLTAEETATVMARRADRERRKLVTTIDGFSFIYSRGPTTREELLQEVEVYRDTDYGTVILQPGGADMVNYPSAVGERAGQDLAVFQRGGDRRYAESIKALNQQGINPTQTLIEGAHGVGMQVHIGLRPAAWVHSPPLDDFFTSSFYRAHPEWRCVDRDGTPVARMSLAVPEVRAHLVAVLREAAGFGADGACVIYVRGTPYILYEKPFADLFRQRHGVEAQSVEETDARLLALRAEIMTGFMREIRQMLDEVGGQGKRLQLSAFVLANEADNRRYGLDLRQWVSAKLVDLVMPYQGAGGGSATAYDMAFFREVCGPAGVQVKPTFIGWGEPGMKELLPRALALYEQGADGLTVWDGNTGEAHMDRWSVMSRLGSRKDIAALIEEGVPGRVTLRFHRLGDMVMDGKYSPNWGY